MLTLMADLRYSIRTLGKNPGFTLAVVLTLALGIGATTAIFSVVNNTMLRPMMVDDVDRLVRLDDFMEGELGVPRNISGRNIEAVRKQNTAFESVTVQRYQPFVLHGEGEPERLRGASVSPGWLRTLGIQPVVGRGFGPDEHAEGEQSEAVLIGHGLWQRRYGASPEVVGRSVLLNGRSRTVVGVLPRGFRFPYEGEIWTPIEYDATDGQQHNLLAFGRLKPGATIEQAQSELRVISERLTRAYPETNDGWVIQATDLRDNLIRGYDRTALALLMIVGFLLIIACVNVANLMLASAVFRQKEMAIRSALGASRGRQIRQLATESVVLSLIGGALGLAFALWARPYLSYLVPPVMSVELAQDEIVLDFRIVLFVFGVSLVSGLVASLLPKLRATDFGLRTALQESGRSSSGRRGRRLGRGIVAAEFSLAMILLVGASLVVQGFVRAHGGPLGFEPGNLLTMRVSLPEHEYAESELRNQLARDLLARLEGVAGVDAVALTTSNPLLGGWSTRATPESQIPDDNFRGHLVNHTSVSPGFFETLGISLLRGRAFTPRDDADHPGVTIISRSMAQQLWPGDDALGKRVKQGGPESDNPWLTVIGVADEVRHEGEIENAWYLPYAQHRSPSEASEFHLMIRTPGNPGAVSGPVQDAIWDIDPDIPVYGVSPMAQVRSTGSVLERAGAAMGTAFGIFALILAGLGVYGVMAYAVSQSRRSWAIRKALGASRGRVVAAILREAARSIVPGILVGLIGAWVFVQLLARWLSDIGSPHPGIYPATALVLGLIGLAACLGPARKASRIEPAGTLREE